MDEAYHYPPELLNLLVDTIPLLCRAKNDVLVFFRGAGVSVQFFSDLSHRVKTDRENINKYEISRTVLQRVNEKGDSELRTRREIIKRVVEFEDFSTCWNDDRLKAKGLVGEIRRVVNVKDSFSRINKERETEREERAKLKREAVKKIQEKESRIEKLKKDLYALFALEDQPQKRGKYLESILNDLFRLYGILIREDFKRVDPDGAGIIEQIDGVVEFDGNIYLVEMKWVKDPVGVEKISQHLVRLFGRDGARGLFIASNGYADTAITQCKEALSQKVISLITLKEIVHMLECNGDLLNMLRKKVQSAIVDKKPFIEMLA